MSRPSEHPGPTLHALLIGIDHYLSPPPGYEGARYSSLGGCVQDVERMERFLLEVMGVPPSRIRKLIAPDPPCADAGETLPTYVHVVAGFQALRAAAEPGDQVLIHYSGHGGRTPTAFPRLKGYGSHDEGIVPTDVGDETSQYLRDVELAFLLEALVRADVFVTLVMDCCHAGGTRRKDDPKALRALRARPRKNEVQSWRRTAPSRVAGVEELEASWRRFSAAGAGSAPRRNPTGGWEVAPAGRGYVFLAACQPHEYAYEYEVGAGQRGGALTYWLLDTLETRGTGINYRQLFDRLSGKIRTLFQFQTPQLEGEEDRRVFGTESLQLREAVNVLGVEGDRVRLNTGQAQAVRYGARFAVFPPGWSNDDLSAERLAVVEIDELGGTVSWARILERCRDEEITAGARALPLEYGQLRRKRTWKTAPGGPSAQREALAAVARAVERRRSGFLEQVASEQAAEREVTVDADGRFEIRDVVGRPVPNLRPALPVDAPGAAAKVAQRLEHLARFRNVEELHNHDPESPLARTLCLELGYLPPGYDPMDLPAPVRSAGRRAEVEAGEWLCLTIRNLAGQPVNVAVLDLGPRWNIQQIHPRTGTQLVLDPDQEERVPLRATLASHLSAGTDVLKVFAAIDATSYRWLELPVLDEPFRLHKAEPPRNALEALLQAIAADRPAYREMLRATYASREWTVAQVEVRIRQRRTPVW